MNKIFFTPGPAALYFSAEQHLKDALKKNIPSISHRGKEYMALHKETIESLRNLLNVPSNFHIGFTSSATEVWERSIEGLVNHQSFHFVNGSFSEKFYRVAAALGKNAIAQTAEPGSNNNISATEIPAGTELITLAQNETSTGAAVPTEDISGLRKNANGAIIAVDTVSSAPIVDIPFDQVDSVYFSVQKCFGMPAGLGVWIYNEKCLEKAEKLKKEGIYHDAYNGLLNIHKFGLKNQTSCTPNVLNIYLLGKIAGDMVKKGIGQIRREALYKSALIYNLFENNDQLQPFVQEKKFRSVTVGVAEVLGGANPLLQKLEEKGLVLGGGYGSFKGKHIRIANFPTHSKEQIEMLVDTVSSLEF